MDSRTTQLASGADQNITLQIGSGAQLEFDFDRNDAAIRKIGQDLVLDISDAVELTLEGFFDNFDGEGKHPYASLKNALFTRRDDLSERQ